MYRIVKNEPEGWEKAFVIYFGDRKVIHARFLDTAEDFIKKVIGTD